MGLLELLVAMVVLNIGLFAVMSVFTGATGAIGRAATISSATAVADKQMEIYRSLQNCAIWLDPSATVTVPPHAIPTPGSGSLYEADTKSYTDIFPTAAGTPATPVAYFNTGASSAAQAQAQWGTLATTTVVPTAWSGTIPTSCSPTAGVTPPPSATWAIQNVTGPNGTAYLVYTYIILTEPQSAPSVLPANPAYYRGAWLKQVTVVVRDPNTPTRILARETSTFSPVSG